MALAAAVGGIWLEYGAGPVLGLLGMTGGLTLWQIWRARPTLKEAALAVDRQLNLKELLSTAYVLSNQPLDPWQAAVGGQAEALCSHLKPDGLFGTPLPLRSIGICLGLTGLSLLLAAMPANRVAVEDSPFASNLEARFGMGNPPTAIPGRGLQPPPPADRTVLPQGDAQHTTARTASRSPKEAQSRSVDSHAGKTRTSSATGARGSIESSTTESALVSRSDPQSAGHPGKDGLQPPGGAVETRSGASAAAWQSELSSHPRSGNWARQADAAPAEYRDLIRAYYDHHSSDPKP